MLVTSCSPKELYISYKMKQQCFKCSFCNLYFIIHNSLIIFNKETWILYLFCSINERSFHDICVNLLNYANILWITNHSSTANTLCHINEVFLYPFIHPRKNNNWFIKYCSWPTNGQRNFLCATFMWVCSGLPQLSILEAMRLH